MKRYFYTLLAIWTILIVALTALRIKDEKAQIEEQGRIQARSYFEQNLVTRRWVAGHGGVYVPITEKNQPNPYLNVPNRDIETKEGKKLTLVNPAWMTREIYELLAKQHDTKIATRLVSLKPLNPLNKPDEWEEKGLLLLGNGEKEVSRIQDVSGESYLKVMRPFLTEEACLKCHGHQGYKVGDVRGAISIGIPMKTYYDLFNIGLKSLIVNRLLVWLAGSVLIIILMLKSEKNRRAVEVSNERFKAIAGSTPDHILIQDSQLKYEMVINPQLDLTERDMIGKTDYEIFSEDEAYKLTEIKKQVLETGKSVKADMSLYSKSGGKGFFEGSYVPRFNLDGKIDGLIGYFRNTTENRKAEEALHRSEEKYRSLFDGIAEGFALHEMIYDKKGRPCDYRFLEISSSFEKLTGLQREDIVGKLLSEVLPGEDPKWVEIYGTVVTTGETVHFENYSPALKKHYEVTAYRPAPDQFAVLFIDVTERREKELMMKMRFGLIEYSYSHTLGELLQKSVDEICKITDSPIGFYHFVMPAQETLSLQAWSTRTEREFCKAEGKGLHYSIDKAGVWADAVRQRKPIIHNDYASLPHKKGLPEGHAPVIRELVVPVIRDNRVMSIIGVGNRTSDYNDKDVEISSFLADVAYDVITRKQQELAIVAANEEWKLTFDSAPDLMALIDMEHRITRVNKTMSEKLGKSPQELIGKHCYAIMHGTKVPPDFCPHSKLMISAKEEIAELVDNNLGGRFEVRTTPVRDKTGQLVGSVHIMRDITEHRKLEEQLRQAQKMEGIGHLAGGIAHDFNNILSAIVGYGHLSLMKMTEDDPNRLNIEQILEASERATHLTKDLLLFSRKQSIDRKPVELNGIINRIEKFLKRVIGEDIIFNTKLSENKLMASADSHQFEQVMMNLATNARDAMPKGGTFYITTDEVDLDKEFASTRGLRKSGEYALISISDTGHGMDKETSQKIFEPFFTTKEVGKGTGLGLAVVYGIIQQHNGHISVYSEEGAGTTFRIYLPLIESGTEDIPTTPEEQPIVGGNETILMAEDEEALRKLYQSVLKKYGYTVIVSVDGEDAVNKFKENKDKIELLVFDLVMPKMNGVDAYNAIKKIRPDIKAIFASGYSPDFVRQKVVLDKEAVLIYKPVFPFYLLRKIREVLDNLKSSSVEIP